MTLPNRVSPELADQGATVGMDEPTGYAELLADIKERVRTAQVRATRAANTEVLRLYWSVGHDILVRQDRDGWGSKVVARLAADLHREFPGQGGWSRTNMHYMRQVAEIWPTEDEFVQQAVGQMPWGHVTVLLGRLNTREERDWYAAKAAEEGWTRSLLEHWIKVDLRGRLGAAPTNFSTALDSPDSELAQQLIKDPYVFEQLSYKSRKTERDVEQALMDRLQDTLMEFGRGMAFVGRQVRLEVTDEKGDVEELVLDLLLFHIPQRRFVVVELKMGKFKPSYVGQLGTYVAVVDDQLRDPEYNAPTVGLLLCTGRNESIVRYALATTNAPIGVADYEGVPTDAQGVLPTAVELCSAIVAAKEALRNESKLLETGEVNA